MVWNRKIFAISLSYTFGQSSTHCKAHVMIFFLDGLHSNTLRQNKRWVFSILWFVYFAVLSGIFLRIIHPLVSICPSVLCKVFLSFFRWVNGFVIIKVIMIGNKKMLEMAQLYDIRNGIVRPKKVDRTDQGWRREIWRQWFNWKWLGGSNQGCRCKGYSKGKRSSIQDVKWVHISCSTCGT